MAHTTIGRLAIARARTVRRSVGDQLHDLRDEREVSIRQLAAASGVHPSVISRAEAGEANATIGTLSRIATALGAEPSVRFYPTSGPRLHDHVQVRLIETLLQRLHPRWRARLEVPVYRPARGVIDLVLAEPAAGELIGFEAHGEIRRAERQLRWAAEKTDALPSAAGWPWMDVRPRTSRLLILRSTVATRALVQSSPHLFATAYPGRTSAAVDSLTGLTGAIPEAAIIWIDVRGTASRLLDGPPRGIVVGR